MADDDDKTPAARPPRKRTTKKPTASRPAAATEATDVGAPAEEAGASGTADGVDRAAETVSFTALADTSPTGAMTTDDIVASLSTATVGHLYVHYKARDVTYVMDGGCAARVMAAFAGKADRVLTEDELVPGRSNMGNLWCTIGFDDVLGMSWIPGISGVAPRTMTVDPPPPADQ